MKYQIGPMTMENIFKPNGIENVSDMQVVFDAFENFLVECEGNIREIHSKLNDIKVA